MRNILFLSLLFLSLPGFGQKDLPAVSSLIQDSAYLPAIEKARGHIQTIMEQRGFPSLSISVGKKGQVIWSEAFGWADQEAGKKATIRSQYRIGSVSKSLTALGLGVLYEADKIDLDAPVQTYISEYPKGKYDITTRQLAGHQAGIRHYKGLEFMSKKHYSDVFEPLKVFWDDKLKFEPGTGYSYSTYGWTVISAVMARAADQRFDAFMDEQVIQPLGMHHTLTDEIEADLPHRVQFYMSSGKKYRVAGKADLSNKWAGGGYLANPTDLVLMGNALNGGTFLTDDTRKLLFTPQPFKDGSNNPNNYGLGWRANPDAEGRMTISHSGGSIGGRTWMVMFPESEVSIAVTINYDQGLSKRRVDELADLFIPDPPPADPAKAMRGMWQTQSLHVKVNEGQEDETEVKAAGQADFLKVLQLKSSSGEYRRDGTFSDYYVMANDSLVTVNGTWDYRHDSLIVHNEDQPASAYKVDWMGTDKATFTAYIDWDSDGQKDDLFSGVSKKLAGEMSTYYMVFLFAGDKAHDYSAEELAEIQAAHLANIRKLARAGKMLLAGPFLDNGEMRGIFIIKAASLEEAKAFTETDPAVKAGRLRMEVKPWYGPVSLEDLEK
ncbi:MAG: serine hydrolase [Bacteroidota bacterium]